MKRRKVVDITVAMTKKEKRLFWMLMDLCKGIFEFRENLSLTLGVVDINALQETLPLSELIEVLGGNVENEFDELFFSQLILNYFSEEISQEDFMEQVQEWSINKHKG